MVTLAVTLVLLVVLVVVGAFVRVPYVSLGPGPTVNTLGAVGQTPVVKISGAPVRPTDGNLNLTTVSVTDQLTLFQAIGMWFSGRDSLQPREEVFPPGQSTEETRRQDQQQMGGSEDSATIAALRYLKRPTELTVTVDPKGPAAASLKTGDRVVSVNGAAVSTSDELRDAVSKLKPGAVVTLGVPNPAASVPAGTPAPVEQRRVTLGARPGDTGKGYLGVTPEVVNADPSLRIDFNVGDIGGPSAGLMLTLAVIDKLGTTDLTGGKFIAGTGTISDSGEVGEIGGITHKTLAAREAGATAFLVPAGNCAEARSDVPDGLRLVRVDTLSDAIGELAAIRDGKNVTRC
ncbi:signal protein PDZ [Williamsia sp. Leaf354]|jgi:PDZ domain-containing protein|uniref:YlbL family protein n=1 Tax=Williamsia sp. Leaf354 TaxID=1736349 RepID=UPI0006F9FA46|nr:PDZ domain-containing protein [Williamsia sp. Leaf354]KQR95970.1 signal protein PDZ [Williamsia sp. Leaf354]